VTGGTQRILEEAPGGSGITPGCQMEIDRAAGRIHGTVQISPPAFHPNVGLIHLPGTVCGLQFPTAALQFGRIALDPAPDGGVVGEQTSFGEKLLDVTIKTAKIADTIPPHR
jgi:hypothetical protein